MSQIYLWAFTAAVFSASMLVSEASYSKGSATGYRCPTLFNFYGDSHDCTRFYRCVWGEAYAFTCPAGTRWSQAILTCDHDYNVPCYGADPDYISAGGPSYEHGSESYGSHSTHNSYAQDGYNSGTVYKTYNSGYSGGNYGAPYGLSYRTVYYPSRGYSQYGYNNGNYNAGYSGLRNFLAKYHKK